MQSIRVLFGAIAGGLVLFAAISAAVFYRSPASPEMANNSMMFFGIAMMITVIIITAAFVVYKKMLLSLKGTAKPLQEKLNAYRAMMIVFLALCEGPGLLGVSFFILTGNLYLLLVPLVSIIVMLAQFPSKANIVNQLELTWQEQEELA